jgi:hypothetical protein
LSFPFSRTTSTYAGQSTCTLSEYTLYTITCYLLCCIVIPRAALRPHSLLQIGYLIYSLELGWITPLIQSNPFITLETRQWSSVRGSGQTEYSNDIFRSTVPLSFVSSKVISSYKTAILLNCWLMTSIYDQRQANSTLRNKRGIISMAITKLRSRLSRNVLGHLILAMN